MLKKIMKLTLVSAMALAATPAAAVEPGVPEAMPSGATMGVPVGANFPFPGFYLNVGTAAVRGYVYDSAGNYTDNDLILSVLGMTIGWAPGLDLLGGTYRASLSFAYQDIGTEFGGMSTGKNTSISDIAISPLNIHWPVAPDIFASAGLTINLANGDFIPVGPGAVPSGGQGADSLTLSAGYSYLRDGWNLSVHGNYFVHGENDETDYRSGDQILVNLTAMKDIADSGWNVGPVGYVRRQITDDKNDGVFYGGQAAGREQTNGAGIAVSKRFGPAMVAANYSWETGSEDGIGVDQLRVEVGIPLGAPPGGAPAGL